MLCRAGVVCLVFLFLAAAAAEETGWPREIEIEGGLVTFYQPQIDEFDGDYIGARAAVSVLLEDSETGPIFGAVWIEGRLVVVGRSGMTNARS